MFNERELKRVARTLDVLVQAGYDELCFLVSQFLVFPDFLSMQTLHGLVEK